MDEQIKEGMLSRITHALDYIAANAEQQKRIADALEQLVVEVQTLGDKLSAAIAYPAEKNQ